MFAENPQVNASAALKRVAPCDYELKGCGIHHDYPFFATLRVIWGDQAGALSESTTTLPVAARGATAAITASAAIYDTAN